jgi:NADH dehydrogenase (ubiquinone) 1 alpha subcomplex subunit 5
MIRGVIRRGLSTYKTTTGLVGLRVDPNGQETLHALSASVLTAIQKIPASAQYRIDVEKWFTYIQNITTKSSDIKIIEDEIDLGQIEEVIEMAKTELELIEYYTGYKLYVLLHSIIRHEL